MFPAILLADASTTSVLLGMGLPGVVILGLVGWILLQRTELKDLRVELAQSQTARVTDAQKVTDTTTTLAREVTASLNSNTGALTAVREAINTQAEAARDLNDTLLREKKR
jgi:hypothetical protein